MSSNLKPKTGGLAAILRLEKERRAQEEKEQQFVNNIVPANIAPPAENAPAPKYTPPIIPEPPVKSEAAAEITAPMESTAPAEFAAGTKRTGQPLRNAPAKETTPPAKNKGAALLSADAPHLRTPHEITDRILPTLKPGCQVVLMRLYRLSAGFGSDTCHVSLPKLASACNISETQIRVFLRDLEQRKMIKRLSVDLSNKIQSERGITFEVLLPRLGATKSVAGAKNTGGADSTGGVISEPNKVNTQKESTQTQDVSVRVSSRFTIEECRRYAEHLRSTGQGINNPGGYATTIHRTGEADELIERFLIPTQSVLVDASQCPDCKGSGFYYPNGPAGGVAKCKHENLRAES
jgi:DNA-binding Lrp family transcriptional regulator